MNASAMYAQGVHTSGTGLVSPAVKAENQGTGQALFATPSPTISPVQDQVRLQQFLQDQDRTMQQDRESLQDQDRTMQQDQDRTLLGAKVLIQAQQTIPGFTPQLATLAVAVQNSVQNTLQAEKRIQERNFFATFFFGGDRQTAQEMLQTVTQNQTRIRQMQQLIDNCGCSAEVKTMLQQQLQLMQTEQTRLQQLAQNEINKKGLFSWFGSNSSQQ